MTDLEKRLSNKITAQEYFQANKSQSSNWLLYAMVLRNRRWAISDIADCLAGTDESRKRRGYYH